MKYWNFTLPHSCKGNNWFVRAPISSRGISSFGSSGGFASFLRFSAWKASKASGGVTGCALGGVPRGGALGGVTGLSTLARFCMERRMTLSSGYSLCSLSTMEPSCQRPSWLSLCHIAISSSLCSSWDSVSMWQKKRSRECGLQPVGKMTARTCCKDSSQHTGHSSVQHGHVPSNMSPAWTTYPWYWKKKFRIAQEPVWFWTIAEEPVWSMFLNPYFLKPIWSKLKASEKKQSINTITMKCYMTILMGHVFSQACLRWNHFRKTKARDLMQTSSCLARRTSFPKCLAASCLRRVLGQKWRPWSEN